MLDTVYPLSQFLYDSYNMQPTIARRAICIVNVKKSGILIHVKYIQETVFLHGEMQNILFYREFRK